MNSKQRRKDRKLWRYEVRINDEKVDEYGYDNMFDWCRDTFGNTLKRGKWREKHCHYGTCWQFTDEKTAAIFALRWS